MNTDRELLELAAKAAGYDYITETEGDVFAWKSRDCIEWNPLTDDGDALRLAVKLGMNIEQTSEYCKSGRIAGNAITNRWHQPDDSDPYAATRKAIVRAAAAIGKEQP